MNSRWPPLRPLIKVKFVDWALTQPDYQSSGIALVRLPNLLRIKENLAGQVNAKDPTSTAAVIADLEQEPVQFVKLAPVRAVGQHVYGD